MEPGVIQPIINPTADSILGFGVMVPLFCMAIIVFFCGFFFTLKWNVALTQFRKEAESVFPGVVTPFLPISKSDRKVLWQNWKNYVGKSWLNFFIPIFSFARASDFLGILRIQEKGNAELNSEIKKLAAIWKKFCMCLILFLGILILLFIVYFVWGFVGSVVNNV